MGLDRKDLAILKALDANGEMYGKEIVEATGNIVAHGTVYVRLARLEDVGYLKSRKEELPRIMSNMVPRRRYTITDAGRSALVAAEAPS